MKNVMNLLIFVTISAFMFASQTRVDALGGAGFWADDYANIGAFPASVNNHEVAWTDGNDFTSTLDRIKKLTNRELNDREVFKSENFLNSLREIIEKKSKIKFENLHDIKVFPVYVSDKFPIIKQKNIFLSGDALFAFSPSLAQGASQSIETAQDIFDSIINENDNYYKKRINKISSISLKSKLNHFAFHLSNPLNILVRNLILKYLSKSNKFLENYLGKIYKN